MQASSLFRTQNFKASKSHDLKYLSFSYLNATQVALLYIDSLHCALYFDKG